MNLKPVQVVLLTSLTISFAVVKSFQLVPNVAQTEDATSGPCWGYHETARVAGYDVITIERAREIARKEGLELCVAEGPVDRLRSNDFWLYSEPGKDSKLVEALFSNPELNRQALPLPTAGDGFNFFEIEQPYKIIKGQPRGIDVVKDFGHDSFTLVNALLGSAPYTKLLKAGSVRFTCISKRNTPAIWGKKPSFDVFVGIGPAGSIYRFQLVPGKPPHFAGKLILDEIPHSLANQ